MHSETDIFPFLEACKNVDPGFRLSLRPAAGRQISNCDVALRQYLVTAHDCLMNAAACRTNFHDFTDHQQVIVQSGGSFVADGKIRNSVKALARTEEHKSELQSLMRISYAVFCLKKKNTKQQNHKLITIHIHREHPKI